MIHRKAIRATLTLLVTLVMATTACSGDAGPTAVVPVPPLPSVPLKDIEIANLPSPFYHFEYDQTGRPIVASFASGLTMYNLIYAGGRLAEMQNNIIVNHDRLVYSYDGADRVSDVEYRDANGVAFVRVHFSYDGPTLVTTERQRKIGAEFVTDKTMSLSYDADGNLLELTEHHPAIAGTQDEVTVTDRFEQYDKGINVDGFSLLHSEFFDHLVLLPEVQLQKGNPRKVTRTGDGLNYQVDYTYIYDGNGRPVTKAGDLTELNGPDAGTHVQLSTTFTYY